MLSTVKAALRVYTAENERDRAMEEQAELKILEKILNNQPIDEDGAGSDHEEVKAGGDNQFMPSSEDSSQQTIFEKIVQKLLEYNEKMNNGKEISVVEYLKRLDQRCVFL